MLFAMKIIVFGAIFLLYFPVLAQTELLLNDTLNKVSIGSSCYAFKNNLHKFSEKDFGNPEFESHFQPIKNPSFGYSDAPVWVKVLVKNTSKNHWYLELDNPSINIAECYFTQSNIVLSKQKLGDFNDFDSYIIKDRNPIFDLQLRDNVECTLLRTDPQSFVIYLKLQNTEDLSFPLIFWEEKALMGYLAQRNIFWGIFFGFILLIAIYNFFLWLSIQEKSYLFYVGYVLSFGLFQASLFGYGFQYLWGNGTFNEKAHVFFVGLTTTFLVLFSIYFLEIYKILPHFRKYFRILGIFWIITFPILVLSFNETTNYFIVGITLIGICLQYYFCIKLVLVKSRNVRYYLLATICFTFAIFIVILKGFGIFFTGDYYLKLGSMLEIILFSLALGDKYRQEHLEKQRQQRIRDEISANLHDDLAASLSSLTMYSESNRRKSQTNAPENAEIFKKISEKSREILNLVRENVWEMNPRNDVSDEWLDRMLKFAIETLESKQIDLELHISEEIRKFILPVDYRHDLYLFFKECVNNIAKHSEANLVKIQFNKNKNYLELIIKDNGKGFIINDLQKGNGLLNLKKRAENIKGKYNIESEIGKGTVVWLKLNL